MSAFRLAMPDSYPQNILDHYEDPYHRGACDRPTHRGDQLQGGCGDTLLIELQVVGEEIRQVWFQGEGCIVNQSAASMLAEHLEGESLESLDELSADQIARIMGYTVPEQHIACCQLLVAAVQSAAENPIDEDEDGPTFLGLNLGDEC